MKKDNTNIFLSLIVAIIIIAGGISIVLLSGEEPDRRTRSEKTIAENIQSNQQLTTFAQALEVGGFIELLNDTETTHTVFAPTNEAFAAIEKDLNEILENQNEENLEKLKKILSRHIVAGEYAEKDLDDEDLTELETIDGQKINVAEITEGEGDAELTYLTVNKAEIFAADEPNTNGVLHIVGAVL